MVKNKIRVATATLSRRIFAGYPTKNGMSFREPRHDVTEDAVRAIVDHIGLGGERDVFGEDGRLVARILVVAP